MLTHCYLDDPTPKVRAAIEDLKLFVADIQRTVAVQDMYVSKKHSLA